MARDGFGWSSDKDRAFIQGWFAGRWSASGSVSETITLGTFLDAFAWFDDDPNVARRAPTEEEVLLAIEDDYWMICEPIDGKPKRDWPVDFEGI